MRLNLVQGWQVILADLSLILFVVTLAGLAGNIDRSSSASTAVASGDVPVQSLYRPTEGGPDLAALLDGQALDARARLRITLEHDAAASEAAFAEGARLSKIAADRGVAVSVELVRGKKPGLGVYARLVYDRPGVA